MTERWLISPWKLGVGLAVFGAIVFVAGLLTRKETALGWNTPMQFDDFCFSVVGVRQVAGAPEGWTRHVVSFKIDNRAKRVSYRFRRGMAVAVDSAGRRYPISADGQERLDAARKGPDPCAAPLPAGTSGTTELVFDLPAGETDAGLKLTFGPVGDAVESLIASPKRFSLRPPTGKQ
jgi:hypothetical protein